MTNYWAWQNLLLKNMQVCVQKCKRTLFRVLRWGSSFKRHKLTLSTDGLISALVRKVHPSADDKYRQLLKLKYTSWLHQWRYFLKDYVIRRPYKVIRARCEFGPELKFYVPFAYWHWKRGTLLRTESCKDTSAFYFFSPNHIEHDRHRGWVASESDIPNSEDHGFWFNLQKWNTVPFREEFKGDLKLSVKKPLLIISNKYNTEWNKHPINYIGIETLEALYKKYSKTHTIVYNRPLANRITQDNSTVLNLEEGGFLQTKCPEVVIAEALYANSMDQFRSFNHFQLALYAQCSRFISVQGGNSVLASFFGGVNLVLCKEGLEINFREYERFYPKLSGANVIRCNSDAELLHAAGLHFF